MSADYYHRIEHGRERPSDQVLDDQMREFYRDWESMTAWAGPVAARFRRRTAEPELDAVIDELRTCSVLFDQLWVHHDVVKHGGGLLLVSDHIMSTYWADPGSPSERALRRLTVCEVS